MNIAVDPRDRAIGEANIDNVQELLYSIALYPMTHLKGYVTIGALVSFSVLMDLPGCPWRTSSYW